MSTNKILLLFAHPRFEQSRSNAALVKHLPDAPNLTFHDLYENYPDFNVNIAIEKQLLLEHNIIILHHPFYWYSAPPLVKQWIDMVLEFGWAYGPGGDKLAGKLVFNTITSGGARNAYQRNGRNRFTVRELLAPFEQTFRLCSMTYLPPFAVQGTHQLSLEELEHYGSQYQTLLQRLLEGDFEVEQLQNIDFLNDWTMPLPSTDSEQ